MRVRVVKLKQKEHLLLCTLHQTVSDSWSIEILIRELATLYAALVAALPPTLPPLPIQYADYAIWQRQWLSGESLETRLAYWREQLVGLGRLELPTDRPRPPVPSFLSARRHFRINTSLREALQRLSRSEGVTAFMVLLAGIQTLLSRWTSQTDIPVGTLLAGRTMVELEGLIGRFSNTVTLRGDLSGEPSFRDLLNRTRGSTLGAFTHQDMPFELLVEEIRPERDLSRAPLFQVLMTQRNRTGWPQAFAGLSLEQAPTSDGKSPFDLGIHIEENDEGWVGAAEYSCDLFDAPTIERLVLRFELLLRGVAANPDERVAELQILPEFEQAQLLWEWNDTAAEGSHLCLHDLFMTQAARTPDAIALIWDNQRLTYRELDRQSNQLARRLRDLGVGPEALVGVFLERSPDLVVLLLGVLKAGGAYVPLLPDLPAERLAFLLEDSGATLLISSQNLSKRLLHDRTPLFLLEEEKDSIAICSDAPLERSCGGDNLAYIIYTSGSTGRPKGVAIEHRSATMLVRWASEMFSSEDLAGVLAATPISFDLSVFEFFVPLALGGKVILATNQLDLPDSAVLSEITLINTVPALIARLIELGLPPGLRTVNVGGDWLARQTVDSIYSSGNIKRVLNLYGPSEDTTYSTCERLEREGERQPSIGRPITGKYAFVLDKRHDLVSIGAPGELCLGGVGLARGYLGRPDLTADRFRPNPFGQEPGSRLYKTGDFARHMPDGRLDFLGRIDQQVKLRGLRIELGEIEAVLSKHQDVNEAVVAAVKGGQNDLRLVAYIVPSSAYITINELRSYLRESLPDYMVPSAFVMLASLPLTSTGKVDRRALPLPESVPATQRGEDYVLPRTHIEEILAGIWEEILGVETGRISVLDDFFALGGHSLSAFRLLSRVREAFAVDISLRHVFENPTVRSVASKIHEASARSDKAINQPSPIDPNRRAKTLASFAQERFWVLAELGVDDRSYNVPVSLRLEGHLDRSVLESALCEITNRHEVLRATFALSDHQLIQRVVPQSRCSISLVDLQNLAGEGVASFAHEAARLWDLEAEQRFDLSDGPLMRAALLRLGPREHLLFVTFHHIVIDAWSIDIFVRELEVLYSAFYAGRPSPMPQPAVRYSDFADRQRRWLTGKESERQRHYWKERLTGASEVVTFPTDRPRPEILGSEGNRIAQPVEDEVLLSLKAIARRRDSTVFMVLLAAFEVLLRRYTGQQDLVFGTPVANRRWQETEDVIGLFLNTVVLRDQVSGNPTFEELFGQVRESFLGALENQDFPFEKLLGELRPDRNLSHSPLIQILVVHRRSLLGERGALIRDVQIGSMGAKFDMTFSFLETGNRLNVEIEYNRDLFDESTVRRIQGHLFSLFQGISEGTTHLILDYAIVPESERHLLLSEWNDTQAELQGNLVHERFSRQARLTPSAVAVVWEGESLTYGELDIRSSLLAHRLASRGVGPEAPVALLMDRTLALVTAVLAVLRTGGAYVPLDPETPAERVAWILRDLGGSSGHAFVLAETRFLDRLPEPLQLDISRCISFESECAMMEHEGGRGFTCFVDSRNLAYVLYTSGTSGVPKGVAVEHRSVGAFLDWAASAFTAEERRTVLAATPITFDLSVFELFLPLTTGGCVLLMRDALTLLELTPGATSGVSLVNTVPSLMSSILGSGSLPKSAATVNLAGEALRRPVVSSVFKAGTVRRLLNLYGPTEATVYATVATISPEDARDPNLGRPIRNTQAYVVNEVLKLQPIGAPGELVLGGEGIAREYWNRPDLTADRFIPNPFGGAGARLYRTGDLARWLPDGNLEFLGRLDRQVKVRGLRIEPGDIEASLLRHQAVDEVIVVAKVSPQGDAQLVAYVRPKEGEDGLRASDLRTFLQQRLPRGLVPTAIVLINEIFRTVRGKVDYERLPQPDWAGEEAAEFIPPRSPAERRLAEIWSEVLGVTHLSANDNFFDRGGFSLRAAQVAARLREVGVELPLRRIFEKPQLGELAREIEEEMAASAEKDSALWTAARKEAAREPFALGEEVLTQAEGAEVTDLLSALLEEKAQSLKRRPVLSFPASCTLNAPTALHFQLVAMAPADPLLLRLARLRVLQPACVETLFVKVTAPAFRVSPHLARMQVFAVGDSDLVAFKVVPLEQGVHVVEVEVFAGADRVGYYILETEAVSYVN